MQKHRAALPGTHHRRSESPGTFSGNQLRGYHLYVWKKRGVFKNVLSREYGPKGVIPEKPIVKEQVLTHEDIDEIESRLAALKPYLKRETFEAGA